MRAILVAVILSIAPLSVALSQEAQITSHNVADGYVFVDVVNSDVAQTLPWFINDGGTVVASLTTDTAETTSFGFDIPSRQTGILRELANAGDTGPANVELLDFSAKPEMDIVGSANVILDTVFPIPGSKDVELDADVAVEPDPENTMALGVSPRGQILGIFADRHGFVVDENGQFKVLNHPDGTFTMPIDMNASGTVVGFMQDAQSMSHGFTYNSTTGRFTTFDVPGFEGRTFGNAITETGIIVGHVDDDVGQHGFIMGSDGAIEVLDHPLALAAEGGTCTQAINNVGNIAGHYTDSDGVRHGYIHFADGTWADFDHPLAVGWTILIAINDEGSVVGHYRNAEEEIIGFVAQPTVQ